MSVDWFSKHRWLVARSMKCEYRWIAGNFVNEVITSDVQALVVKVDHKVSIVEVKSSLMGEWHSVGGSISVPEELLVSASAANAAIEKSVWEVQNVARSLDEYVESVYSTTSDPDGALVAWTAETVGRVVGRSQSGVSEEWTVCERRKRRNCRKASVPNWTAHSTWSPCQVASGVLLGSFRAWSGSTSCCLGLAEGKASPRLCNFFSSQFEPVD